LRKKTLLVLREGLDQNREKVTTTPVRLEGMVPKEKERKLYAARKLSGPYLTGAALFEGSESGRKAHSLVNFEALRTAWKKGDICIWGEEGGGEKSPRMHEVLYRNGLIEEIREDRRKAQCQTPKGIPGSCSRR